MTTDEQPQGWLSQHTAALDAERALIKRLGGEGVGPLDVVRAASWALQGSATPVSVEDLAAACGRLAEAHRYIDMYECDLIDGLLDRGQTWEQVARALGRKGAASARLRYRKVGGRRPDPKPDTPPKTRDGEE